MTSVLKFRWNVWRQKSDDFIIRNSRLLRKKEDLLKEFISPEGWHLTLSDTLGQREVTALSYDSRDVTAETLFVKD